MNLMEKLLEKLNNLWNSSDDERFKGENPACVSVLESIEKKFSNMTDDEIREVLNGLSEEQLEQLTSVFEDMVDERGFMTEYLLNSTLK
jgi:hypothetical protein